MSFFLQAKYVLFCIILLPLVSCSSSKEVSSSAAEPAKDFDAEAYYNPYDLSAVIQQSDTNFSMAKIKKSGGRRTVTTKTSAEEYERLQVAGPQLSSDTIYKLYVDEEGNVRHVSFLNSPDQAVDTSASKFFKKLSFIPGKKDGEPVKSIYRYSSQQ